jgi:FkbM family methyltransferase
VRTSQRVLQSVRARTYRAIVRAFRERPRAVATLLCLIRLIRPRRLRVTLYRSMSWPLVRALAMRLEVRSVGGRMDVDTGDTVGSVIATSGVWEPHVTAVVRGLLHTGDVFVDVGAHVGYYTLLASSVVGDEGHVYAFEPSRARADEVRGQLERNLQRRNVTLLELAAGSAAGTATLYEAPRTNTAASTLVVGALDPGATSYSATQITVVRADSCMEPDHLGRTRVVKVDVEGYEVEALEGLSTLLATGQPLCLIVEVNPEWSVSDPVVYLDKLCRAHDLVPWRIANEYTRDCYFPHSIEPPVRLEAIPNVRADLALARGLDPLQAVGVPR